MGVRPACFLIFLSAPIGLFAQVSSFPYVERFDSVQTPALPSGWLTSFNRLAAGDFFTTSTSPRSSPHAVQSTNSTIPQFLVTPEFDFTGRVPQELRFFLSRSGTHTSDVLVEASTDGGSTWPLIISDTLRNPGSTAYVETVLPLPRELSDLSSCRIRWRVLGRTGGTSGTLRIDDILLTVYTAHDLALTSIRLTPSVPSAVDLFTISVTVRSLGVFPASGYRVNFFLNSDRDGGSFELFGYSDGPDLHQNDSSEVFVSHGPLPPGEYHCLVSVAFEEDENPSNDTVQTVFHVGVTRGSIAVNEIMYAPSGDEPEWVELFNNSSSAVNLRDWRISDSRTSVQSVITRSDLWISSHSYGIVARDSSFFLVHDSVAVPVAVTAFSALNNSTPDAVVLFDPRGGTMDSVLYQQSWGGSGGRSLERVDSYAGSTDARNWLTSVSPRGSTPGRANSIAIAEVDLALQSVTIFGSVIAIQVLNAGRRSVESFEVSVKISGNSREIATIAFRESLHRGAIVLLSYRWSDPPAGTSLLLVEILLDADERPGNNIDSVVFLRGFDPGALVVNEIMYEPLSGRSEWVEFFNPGPDPIDLKGWSLADAPTPSGNRTVSLVRTALNIGPGGFAVLAADSSFLHQFPDLGSHLVVIANQSSGLGLGNDGDAVVLRDPSGTTVDSVAYSPAWHHPGIEDPRGRSLERIRPDLNSNDPRSWSTSANLHGSSPGSRNSIYTPEAPSSASLSFSPNPFSPDNDGYEDFCIIRFVLPHPSSILHVRIFDLQGRLIRTLADGDPAGSVGELVWDGMESGRRKARIGPYIVLLESLAGDGSRYSARGVVVVAARL
jgi:hypothetical protein